LFELLFTGAFKVKVRAIFKALYNSHLLLNKKRALVKSGTFFAKLDQLSG